MESPEKSSNARVAAILALVAVFVVVLIVIVSAGGGGGSGDSSSQATGPAKRSKQSHRKIYVVKPGDTFSRIAQKVGISVDKLQRLNPHVDQFTLQSGDRVKLR